MMMSRYAALLTDYCLRVVPGERVLIRSTPLALPLVEAVHAAVIQNGGIPVVQLSTSQIDKQTIESDRPEVWLTSSQFYRNAVDQFQCILTISAPENSRTLASSDPAILSRHSLAQGDVKTRFMTRSGTGELKWCLCLYPTPSLAQDAQMGTAEFETFVFDACGLFEMDPVGYWLGVSRSQQVIVDQLNQSKQIRYASDDMDISFSVDGRRWINSDGRRNMPSGEVFTSPVESSVNGHIRFDFPVIYQGIEMTNTRFEVIDGKIEKWSATSGQTALDGLMAQPGARYFGEVAIGTNTKIQRHIKNILFDEKIGGTIHMAIGASYPETGGKNESPIHLDFIAEMRISGQIYSDGALIYEKGQFLAPFCLDRG